MSDATDFNSMALLAPLRIFLVASFFIPVALIDPLLGAIGAVLVGGCWVVLGPLPAVAVGVFVVAALGTQPLLVLGGLQLPLGAILLHASLDGATPSRQVAGTGAALAVIGGATMVTWLWTGSVPVAAVVTLAIVTLGLYTVHRYETAQLGSTSAQSDEF